jgi:hypothetical protein
MATVNGGRTPIPPVWTSRERAVFFRPWWRIVVTVVLTLVPLAAVPALRDHPPTETWLGLLSVAPIYIWLWLGLRRIARQRTVD